MVVISIVVATSAYTINDKAAKRLNLLRMLKYKLNRKSLVIIYNEWIRPVLEYGNIIVGQLFNQRF